MHQIIFLDIDGTLRDEVYGVPETAKIAIRCVEKIVFILVYVQEELLEQ